MVFVAFAAVLQAQAPVSTLPATADPWGDDVRAFAEKIFAAAGPPHSVFVSVKNISSIGPAAASSIEQELRSELTHRGFLVAPAVSAESELDVTLSENIDGYLWIAETRSRTGDQVIFTPVRRPRSLEASTRPAPILRNKLLLRQLEALLDFAQLNPPDAVPSLLLLEPDRLTFLQQDGDGWTMRGSAAIPHSRPWPRDLRGHLTVSISGEFKAFLPGILCAGNLSPELKLECREDSAATWPIGEKNFASFARDRNYFSGFLLAADAQTTEVPISYSITSQSVEGSLRWILTGTDGNARLAGKDETAAPALGHWGDDIASVTPACGGAGWNVLATGTGDWTQRDHLQTYEIVGSNATPVGQPLEFSGPVVALWPSDDGRSVRTVSRNLETGMYEGSIVSLSCGN